MFFILSISLLAYLSYLFVFVVCLLCAQLCWQILIYALRKQLVKAQKSKAESWHRIKFSSDAKYELKWWHHALQYESKVSLLHYVKWSDPLGVLNQRLMP